MARLAGKKFLITGASGFMGADFSRAFAREGADLVLTSRTMSRLEALAAELRRDYGINVHCVAADMASNEDMARLAEAAWSAFDDGIDGVLVNGAPSEANLGDIISTPDKEWAAMYEILVWGPMRLLRSLAPKMIGRGRGGSIITVISSTGLNPTPGFDAYGLAKGSLLLLTKYMAREWGHAGIRANTINPGAIVSVEGEARMQAIANKTGMLSRVSLGRVGYNSEVVGAAVYLASDEAGFTSGQLINIDGGRF